MRFQVKLDADGRVETIETVGVGLVLPGKPIPEHLLPLVNNHKGIVKQGIEVIPCSGQQWNRMSSKERSELLELVEFTGGNRDDYIRHFQSMVPNNPKRSK